MFCDNLNEFFAEYLSIPIHRLSPIKIGSLSDAQGPSGTLGPGRMLKMDEEMWAVLKN